MISRAILRARLGGGIVLVTRPALIGAYVTVREALDGESA